MNKKIFTIGSATMDVFVECESANIVSVNTKDKCSSYMSYPYGAKVEMSNFSTKVGGGGVNTAINFANLGYDTTAIFKIGDDIYSQGIMEYFKGHGVHTDCIIQDNSLSTGFSIILTSFQGDRTVLANRGANACIKQEDICFEKLKNADWLYIAPLNGESNKVLAPLVEFAKNNGVKVCFNAGTTSLKQGFEYLKPILGIADIVVMNKDEAMMATGITVRPDTKNECYSNDIIHQDIKSMLEKLKNKDYQVIVITDGGNGAYAYTGRNYYACPVFPSEVISTLGAGDAFASTFCGALYRTNFDVGRSLMYASVESSSVVSNFGATEGLLTFEQIETKLVESADYTYVRL